MDGEGDDDTVSRGRDPFHSINSDGGDATPSQYSSCGESEFERYCSANSVLGTPSVCSSSCGPSFNDFMESDFGSLKSLDGFGLDSNRNFEDKKLLNSVIDRLDGSFEENDTGRLEICGESSNKLDTRIWEIGNGDLGRVDRGKNEDCLNDDSICASGSDDEDRKNLYFRGNVLPGEEGKVGGENRVIMSSSVAFGSEDWDDFELQTGGGIGASLSLDKFQQQEQGLANDGNLFSSIPAVSTVAPVIGEAEIGEDVIEERSGIGNGEGDDLREKLNSVIVSTSAHELAKDDKSTSVMPFSFPDYCERQQEDARDISFNCNQARGGNDTTELYKSCPVSDFFEVEQEPLVEITPRGLGSNFTDPYMQVLNPSVKSEEFNSANGNNEKASENAPGSVIPYEDHSAVVKVENFEFIEFYHEFVNEMEEILLDSSESPGARFPQGNHIFQSQLLLPPRDGGSTASTSGTNEAYSLITHPKRIDRVEVVGAKQKKGDVSLSERLVGVKGYTMYVIRLKSLFAEQGWTLPSPWSSVEKESRKIFGNASPDVVSERSVLIKECLHSTILSGFFSSPHSALVWFLCPQDSFPSSPAARTPVAQSIFSNKGAALGWGKPRLCEYTGQLFCSSCHTNKTAVLPARVLHYWDFNEYPVSHLAKSYLDSIHEQPMLCVSAVNPLLFSKVPALHHIMDLRKKIGTMLPYVRCPFHRNVNKALGSRRYLLESNDFFALRDLIDLSRGAFAALPVMVETVSRKILEHITEQCLICCDVGVPCGARQACNDPSSLIFPFQEVESERCASQINKACFRKLTNCSCGTRLAADQVMESTDKLSRKASGFLLGRRSDSSLHLGLLSGLLSKAHPEKVLKLDVDYHLSQNSEGGSVMNSCLVPKGFDFAGGENCVSGA
uniref:FHA domain-containing protein n=1 Tax=Salix viminalis TaxID=40686 RepID=A0A6N2LB75_SALVM